MILFPSMPKQCNILAWRNSSILRRQRRAHYKGTTRLTSPLQPVFLHQSSIDTGTFPEWQFHYCFFYNNPLWNIYLSDHTRKKFFNSLLIYYLLLSDFSRWQTQGNDNKTARSKRASTWHWSEAAGPTLVIPHLCLSAATLCSCVPCPLPWATTKALGISEAFVFIPRTYLPSCRTVTVKLTLNYAVSLFL